MTYKKTRYSHFSALAICTLLCIISSPQAKADDGGSWLSLQANKSWEKAYAFARFEHRTFNGFSQTEAAFISLGGGYRFVPWLRTDLSYELWSVNPDVVLHKVVFCANGTLSRNGLAVMLREKLEFSVNPSNSATSFVLRTRLRAQYDIPQTRIRPYAMAEVFSWTDWIRSLYYAGMEFSFGKHSMLDVFYMYHLPSGATPIHLIGVGYYFNF